MSLRSKYAGIGTGDSSGNKYSDKRAERPKTAHPAIQAATKSCAKLSPQSLGKSECILTPATLISGHGGLSERESFQPKQKNAESQSLKQFKVC